MINLWTIILLINPSSTFSGDTADSSRGVCGNKILRWSESERLEAGFIDGDTINGDPFNLSNALMGDNR